MNSDVNENAKKGKQEELLGARLVFGVGRGVAFRSSSMSDSGSSLSRGKELSLGCCY